MSGPIRTIDGTRYPYMLVSIGLLKPTMDYLMALSQTAGSLIPEKENIEVNLFFQKPLNDRIVALREPDIPVLDIWVQPESFDFVYDLQDTCQSLFEGALFHAAEMLDMDKTSSQAIYDSIGAAYIQLTDLAESSETFLSLGLATMQIITGILLPITAPIFIANAAATAITGYDVIGNTFMNTIILQGEEWDKTSDTGRVISGLAAILGGASYVGPFLSRFDGITLGSSRFMRTIDELIQDEATAYAMKVFFQHLGAQNIRRIQALNQANIGVSAAKWAAYTSSPSHAATIELSVSGFQIAAEEKSRGADFQAVGTDISESDVEKNLQDQYLAAQNGNGIPYQQLGVAQPVPEGVGPPAPKIEPDLYITQTGLGREVIYTYQPGAKPIIVGIIRNE